MQKLNYVFPNKPSDQCDPCNENHRNTEFEIPFSGFVVKFVHGDKSAERTAEKRQDKQRQLADTEFAVDRLFLVDAEHSEGNYVNYNQPYVKIFHCGLPLFFKNTAAETANSRI